MIDDRVRRPRFYLKQEFIAQMLGVYRPSVSLAARVLQKAGLIRYSRGEMEILDSEGLHEAACECYDLIDEELNRLFGQPWRELLKREDREM